MANHLANATSPYLRQHADNPVHWQEWSEAAFAEARTRNVPVFLSVGYAACHWCHVMAHESFEDETVAQALNEGFVSIKVDREERPDVDAVYMSALTATTGAGGWPMSVFLTPDGAPFYCSTYLPRDALLRVLAAIEEAWHTREDEVRASGLHIASELRRLGSTPPPDAIDSEVLSDSVSALEHQFDRQAGGFGGAPKFPPSMVLEFLLRHHARTGEPRSLAMTERTLEAMARSGMYDQLGGGFARYSVDARWVVPHFEKMLYDNALLLRVYLHWWRAGGSPLAERVVRETVEFLLRDLTTDQDGLASSLDADTEGVEGLTYVWTPHQLREALGPDEGRWAATAFVVTETGTFEHGSSTLQLPTDPADPDDRDRLARVRSALKRVRDDRPQPGRDDKVVTSWNGLAIAALAEAGALFDEPAWVEAASHCAGLLLELHVVDGVLRRSSRAGIVGDAAGVADDHGNLAEGLLALHQASGETRWLEAAGLLLDTAIERFAAEDGGFHDTAHDAEQLFLRPRGDTDTAEPSSQSSLAGALVTYGALTGSPRHLEAGRAAVASVGSIARQDPRFAGWALAVAEALEAGPLQVAIVGSDPAAMRLSSLARRSTSPGLVLAHGDPDEPGRPLLAGRPLVGASGAAYVCRGFVCVAPVTNPADLARALAPSAAE